MLLDLYCERTAAGLFNEPLNVVSNAAFFAAALAVSRARNKLSAGAWPLDLLIALMFAIAAGSTVFHMFATRGTSLLDTVPILLFQVCYLFFYLLYVTRIRAIAVIVYVGVFLAIVVLTEMGPPLFNGTIGYAPALAALLIVTFLHWRGKKQRLKPLIAGCVVFSVSLACRTVDAYACPYLPIGTHFVWHLLNGVFLYLIMLALVANWDTANWDTAR